MLSMIKDGGGPALLAAFLGVLGILVGIGAACTLAMSRRTAFVLGLVALGFASASAAIGGAGVAYGRNRTEAALSGTSIDPAQRARIEEEGESEAAASGRVGAMFAFLPLLLGAIAVFGGAGADPPGGPLATSGPPEPGPGIHANVPGAFAPSAPPGKGRWILAGVFAAIALACVLGALAGGLSAPYPNPNEYRTNDTDF